MAYRDGRGKSGSATATKSSGGVVLPPGVELFEGDLSRVYTFETDGGNSLDFTINNVVGMPIPARLEGRKLHEVEFSVNGNYIRSEALPPRENIAIASRVRSIMRADAASRPDGFEYITSATTQDGLGAARARLYSRAGFSQNHQGEIQLAHVQNGRLVPGLAN